MLEEKLKEAIVDELKRQGAVKADDQTDEKQGSKVRVEGEIDLDDLAMVVAGAMAGGP